MSDYLERLAAARGLEVKARITSALVRDMRSDAQRVSLPGRSKLNKRDLGQALKKNENVARARGEVAAFLRSNRKYLRSSSKTTERRAEMLREELDKLTRISGLDTATRNQLEEAFAALEKQRRQALVAGHHAGKGEAPDGRYMPNRYRGGPQAYRRAYNREARQIGPVVGRAIRSGR